METKALTASLRAVISAIHKGLRKQMDAVDSYSMTEIATIGFLSRNEFCLTTELAAMAKVKTQSMSQILKKMESTGIIKRIPSKEDKRKIYITLTASGRRTVEKARYEKDEWLRNLIENALSEKERNVLEKALPVLQKLTEQ